MSTDLDNELRAALRDLVDVPSPTGVAAGAIRQGNRRRRLVRAGSTAGGLALATCLVVAVIAGVVRAPGGAGVATPAGPRLPHVVLVYSGIAGGIDGPADDTSLVLNLATGEYESMPYHTVVPSPDGTRLFVVDGDNSAAHPTRMGIIDRATGLVRWLPGDHGYQGGATWSYDGTRVLLTDEPRTGPPGFTVVDAETLMSSSAVLPVPGPNRTGVALFWAPGDQELFRVVSRIDGDGEVGTWVYQYTLDGTLTGLASFASVPAFMAQISRAGTRLLVSGAAGVEVIQTSNGGPPTAINLTGYAPVGWADEGHLIVTPIDQTRTEPLRMLMLDISGSVAGSVVGSVPLPQGLTQFQSLAVGSSSGLVKGAEGLTF